MLTELTDKIGELRDYFEREMPHMFVHVEQTDSDFDKKLVSILFSKKGPPPLGWHYCLKISTEVLEDNTAPQIIAALESQRWSGRFQQAPDGGVFIFTKPGLEGPLRSANG